MIIRVKKGDFGDYIEIERGAKEIGERDSVMVKVTEGNSYSLGELVITDKLRVFYHHKKREVSI